MTEVKAVDNAGLGLYATKAYKAGEIILQETPLIVFAPKKPEQVAAVRNQFQNIKGDKTISQSRSSAIYDLSIPATIEDDQNFF